MRTGARPGSKQYGAVSDAAGIGALLESCGTNRTIRTGTKYKPFPALETTLRSQDRVDVASKLIWTSTLDAPLESLTQNPRRRTAP
jgi:hypothetical protein